MYVCIPDDSFLAAAEAATVSNPQLFTIANCIKDP
jgi:hypothetical protein